MKTIIATILLSLAAISQAAPGEYKIDPAHSFLSFTIAHLDGAAFVRGEFRRVKGSFTLAENSYPTSVDVEVQLESIDTNHKRRDRHLRSPDFFGVETNLTAQFTMSEFVGTDARSGVITGELSMLGVSQEVSFDLELFGEAKTDWGQKIGARASGQLKRSDFGMTYDIPSIADEVNVEFLIEGELSR